MRPISFTSPLLTTTLLLAALGAHAQEAPDESDDSTVSEEEVVEEEVVEEEVVEEEVVTEEEEVVEGGEEEVVASEAEEDVLAEPKTDVADATAEEAITEGIFSPGKEPWRAPPAGQGVAWGRVVDKESGEPALEGQIKFKSTVAVVLTDF